MLPSDPAVILEGKVFAEGKGNSVILPDVVIRPMDDPTGPISVNQRSPSGPAAILRALAGGESLNSLIFPMGVIRAILLPSVNQRLPSGPVMIPVAGVFAEDNENSLNVPVGVIRSILLALGDPF